MMSKHPKLATELIALVKLNLFYLFNLNLINNDLPLPGVEPRTKVDFVEKVCVSFIMKTSFNYG